MEQKWFNAYQEVDRERHALFCKCKAIESRLEIAERALIEANELLQGVHEDTMPHAASEILTEASNAMLKAGE
jgi:hypothetical protein